MPEDRIAELAVQAERDPSTGTNALPMTVADFERLILAAIRGTVD